MEIKAITFNMHHGKGIDGKVTLKRIAEIIEESEADLVGLNEVDRFFSKRSGFIDQLSWLADRLNMNSSFAATITLKTNGNAGPGQYGNALLSRFYGSSSNISGEWIVLDLIDNQGCGIRGLPGCTGHIMERYTPKTFP